MCQRIRILNRDGWLLLSTRFVRLFAYGFVSVVLVLYLAAVGAEALPNDLPLLRALARLEQARDEYLARAKLTPET